jgi:Outer membrane protein beta-barrel domain
VDLFLYAKPTDMQKKSTLFVVFLFASAISMAQFQKGSVTAHFNIGDIRNTGIRNNPDDKRNFLSFNPGIGYFIKKNWEVGVGMNYSSFHLNDMAHGLYENTSSIGVNLYSNYYFGNGKVKPYLSFQTGWNHWQGKYSSGNVLSSLNENSLYYGLGAGVNWNISSRFAIFAEGSFIRDKPFSRYGHGRSNITVGIRFFLNKKRK